MTPSIDHIVTITNDLAKAVAAATRLGFYCTPLSEHSLLGSANQTIIFEHDYWEFLTFLTATPAGASLRQFGEGRSGVNGICATTDDLDITLAGARSRGLPMSDAIAFGRKIELDGTEQQLAFRVASSLQAPDGLLIFYCEHRTKELLWHKKWQSHPNGSFAIASLTILSERPDETVTDIARLFAMPAVGTADTGYRIDAGRHVVTVESSARADSIAQLIGKVPRRAAVLRIRCRSPDAAFRHAKDGGARVLRTEKGERLAFAPEFGNLVVEFVA